MRGSLRVSDLQGHPDTGGVEVVADSGRAWDDVDVVPFADDLVVPGRVHMGSTLTVVLATDPLASWQCDALLRRTAEAGYVGLALPAQFDVGDSVGLAHRLGLTVLLAHDPIRLIKACWQLMEGRDALTLAYVRKVAGTIQYSASTLTDLLRHLASGVGHAVAVVDSGGVLAEVDEPLCDDLRRRMGEGWADIVQTEDGCAASVRIDSTTRTGLRLVFHGPRLTETHLRALTTAAEVAMPAVAARLLVQEVEHVADIARSSTILQELVERDGQVDSVLSARLTERGWRFSGPHVAIRVVGRRWVDHIELLRLVLGELSVGGISQGASYDDGITAWVAADKNVRTRIQQAHGRMLQSLPVATGVGTEAVGVAQLVRSIRESADAARLALDRARDSWFVSFDQLGPAQLLTAWTRPDTFVDTARETLSALDDEQLRTLVAYLDNESSLVRTAQAVGTHRNTITQRIHRIEKILGANLSDVDTRLALHLAARAGVAERRVTGAPRSGGPSRHR